MKQRRGTAQRHLSEYGFDYGIGITSAAIGSLEFNKNLIDAEVVAVAYGIGYSQKLGIKVPAITLVGKNEEPLRKAFEEFSDWAESTDSDAIELTVVFMKDGGYRLCINSETNALYKRTLQYDTVVNPMAFQVTWIKVINTTSQPFIELREHLSAGIIRPFLLGASRYTGILQNDSQPIPELFDPISHRQELLKFDIRFVDEGSKHDLHWQRIALGSEYIERKPKAEDRKFPKSIVWYRRIESLKRLFPVTLWRSKSCERAKELRYSAEKRGLHEWQIDQAICNLVLSQQIAEGKLYFQGCSKSDWPDLLWKSLCNRFEIASVDEPEFEQLTVENVVYQAILDGKTLLRHYGIKRINNKLERIQYLLQKQSLINAPDE